MIPKRMQKVVTRTEKKLTPKRILHLIVSSMPDLTKTIPKLKANMTPIMTNNVAKTPKIPFLASYLGASSLMYVGTSAINKPTIMPCKDLHTKMAYMF